MIKSIKQLFAPNSELRWTDADMQKAVAEAEHKMRKRIEHEVEVKSRAYYKVLYHSALGSIAKAAKARNCPVGVRNKLILAVMALNDVSREQAVKLFSNSLGK